MPTLLQLPQATTVSATDEVLIQQGTITSSITVATLLGSTQPAITLATGTVLGRVSTLSGLPQAIAIGAGLALQGGTLTTAPVTVSGDVAGGGLGNLNLTLPSITAAGTFSKVTINAKGQVTAGGTIGANDITAALGFTPYSNANPSGFVTGTSLATSLAPFAPLASPTFTGHPTAPTPTASDNSTSVATTAFVQSHAPTLTGIAAGFGIFRALDYGAFFDGTHDDQPGIMAAIAAASAVGGGVVQLPAGHGIIANTITQPHNNVHIVGIGVANTSHLTTSSYDVATALSWTGTPGGIMLSVGPAQNLTNGKSISNADVCGVMFDCAARAGIGIQIQSTSFSKFDLAYYQPLQCGVHFGTVFLQQQQSATSPIFEINDTQHNQIEIAGYTSNSTTTTVATAVAPTGSSSVTVVSSSGFTAGMQVRVGASLYILQSVSGSTLSFASIVSAADGAAGKTVAFAPRAVWLHAATTDMVPSGVFPVSLNGTAQQYPCVWPGNISLNQIRSIAVVHYTFGEGLVFGYSDHNLADKVVIYTNAGVYGVVFDGSNISGMTSSQNRINYCTAPGIVARGTTTYTYPSADGAIDCIDTINGTPYPAVEPGSSVHVASDVGINYNTKLLNPIVYEAAWEPSVGTYVATASTSLTILNNQSDHIRIATPLAATPVWGITTLGQDLGIRCLAGTGGVQLGGGAAVTVAGNLTVTGATSLATATATAPSASDNSSAIPTTAWVVAKGYLTAAAATASAPVQSVSGRTGSVTLAVTDVAGALASSTAAATYATLASPVLTGLPTAPTPATADSSLNIATTAWAWTNSVPQVATVAALRLLAYTGLPDGQPVHLTAFAVRGDNGGGLFVWNASSSAADNGGTAIVPSGRTGSGRWLRQLGAQRLTPQMFGAKGDGITNDTAAFNAALLAGPVYIPPANYIVANVTMPSGALMEGDVGLGYYGDIAQGTPTSLQQLAPVRPTLTAPSGTTSCVINAYGSLDCIIKGVFIDGGANTYACDGICSGSTRLTMERVTIVRCVNGFGSTSASGYTGQTDLYTHVATIIDCEFSNNTNGVTNLIDSVMIAGAVSANTINVNLGSGANANNFIGVRNEFAINDGIAAFQASSSQVIGGLFDRCAWRAINLGTGCADWTFTGVQFARSGSNNVYPNNSHVALNGTSSVFFNGCISRTGKNDDGTGTLSPAYFINYINTNALVTISGCDVSGYTAGFAFGTNPTAYVQRDNDGAGDSFINAARPYVGNGVIAQTLMTKASANITPAQTATIPVGQSPLTNNYTVTARELVVTATNFNSPFQTCSARFSLAFYRDTTVHLPGSSAAYGEAGGSGIITWSGSGKLQLSASSIASDGSSWTLNVLNGGSSDGSNWGLWAELH